MNISAFLAPAPGWLRRHLVVKGLLALFPNSHDQWIEFNEGARAYVDLRDPEVRNVFLKRSFEPDFCKLALFILSEGGVFFDCGANFGLCTYGLIPFFPDNRVSSYLFEANPSLICYLERSGTLFPSAHLEIIEGCLSDQPGATRLAISQQFTGESHVDSSGALEQRNVVLDDYLVRAGIAGVTFLKLDLEGQELSALRGLSRALKRGAIETIYFEVRTELLQRYGLTTSEIISFLRQNSFRIFYCRNWDLVGQSPTKLRFRQAGWNQLQLLECSNDPGELRTDLLAVHESQILGTAQN
jgi:FkbM family methyltransferase